MSLVHFTVDRVDLTNSLTLIFGRIKSHKNKVYDIYIRNFFQN